MCARYPRVALGFLLVISAACQGRTPRSADRVEIASRLAGPAATSVPAVWTETQRFYASRENAPAWTDWKKEISMPSADAAFNVIRSAEDHGLRASTYQLESLEQARRDLAKRESEIKKDDAARAAWRQRLADFEIAMTTSLLTLGRDVAIGTVEPQRVDERWKARRVAPDFATRLSEALSSNGVESFLDRIRPPHMEYAGLQKALAGLRTHADHPAWKPLPSGALKPGQKNASVAALRARLAMEGYVPDSEAPDPFYDASLESAVRAFQEHHRLPASGVIDPQTLEELNVPVEQRMRQLAINLERWRWEPDDFGDRHFRVNLPRFYLEAREGDRSALEIRTVVGKQGDETPLLSSKMTHVVFSPYWNIPESIVRDETLPAIARDPSYLDRQNIEVVRVSGERAQPVSAASIDWSDGKSLESLAFRQRPGPANSLGLVKFMFPNDYSVYFHDTPADALFHRVGRTFSHGCVRLENPVAMARYVLRDQPEWTDEAIEAAMHAGVEKHVKLAEPIPVHIMYFTAWIDERGGVHYAKDIYGYDAKQARVPSPRSALAGRLLSPRFQEAPRFGLAGFKF